MVKKIIAIIILIITITGNTVNAVTANPYRTAPTHKPVRTKRPDMPQRTENRELINRILTAAYESLKQSEAEYTVLSEKFGMSKPFLKLVKRQEMYVDMIIQIFKKYGLRVPDKDWKSTVKLPATPEEFYSNSLVKEKNLTEMYRNFLKEEIPDEVRAALHKLIELSTNNARLYKFILEAKAKNGRPKG